MQLDWFLAKQASKKSALWRSSEEEEAGITLRSRSRPRSRPRSRTRSRSRTICPTVICAYINRDMCLYKKAKWPDRLSCVTWNSHGHKMFIFGGYEKKRERPVPKIHVTQQAYCNLYCQAVHAWNRLRRAHLVACTCTDISIQIHRADPSNRRHLRAQSVCMYECLYVLCVCVLLYISYISTCILAISTYILTYKYVY